MIIANMMVRETKLPTSLLTDGATKAPDKRAQYSPSNVVGKASVLVALAAIRRSFLAVNLAKLSSSSPTSSFVNVSKSKGKRDPGLR
jgi:hypothetical protein